MEGVNTRGKGRPSSGGTRLQQCSCRTWGARRAGGEMQAEEGAGGAGLPVTCVGYAVTVGVSCVLALLKGLMRPDLMVEASGTGNVVGMQKKEHLCSLELRLDHELESCI